MRRATEIRIGIGSCGVASGAEPVRQALERAGAHGILKAVGCHGLCHHEPMVQVIEPDGRAIFYGNVTPEMAPEIVRRHVRRRWFAHRNDALQPFAPNYLRGQTRIVLENCGEIDPLNIDDYLARDGYRALERLPRHPHRLLPASQGPQPG